MKPPLYGIGVCLFLWTKILFAQATFSNVESISIAQGLSQANVRCLLQDSNGFLWLGTQDGLNRYDGYEFIKFKWFPEDSNSIPGSFVLSLLEDTEGNIWIGTNGGLAKYDPHSNNIQRIKSNEKQKEFFPDNISTMCFGLDGTLWIGDYRAGLLNYDIKNKKYFRFNSNSSDSNGLRDNRVLSVAVDSNGFVWIGTFAAGLYRYDIKNRSFYNYLNNPENPNSISSNTILSLCYHKDKIFIGTINGLNILDIKSNKIKIYKYDHLSSHSISSNLIRTIYKDREGKIWIGTENGGVNLFNEKDGNFIRINLNLELSKEIQENTVYAILRDRTDNIWVGTGTFGAYKFNLNPPNFYSLTHKNNTLKGIRNFSVRSIFVDEEKNLWFGTDNGLYKIDSTKKKLHSYFHKPNDYSTINDNKIFAITMDNNGEMWFGTQKGIARYNKGKNNFSQYTFSEESTQRLPVFEVRSLYADKNNNIWLGTYGAGVFKFSTTTKSFTSYLHQKSNPNSIHDVVVFQIHEDKNKNIWFVAASGLACLNPLTHSYNRYFSNNEKDFPSLYRPMFSLFEDDMKNFWIGTLGDGIIRFNYVDSSIYHLSESDGLANNVVYGIIPDKNKNLWISTNNGISKYNLIDKKFTNFSIEDGLPSNEFNTNAFFKDESNNIYFGCTSGLVCFNPDKIVENKIIPNIVVTNIKVFDQPLDLNKSYFDGEKIYLQYQDNFFSIEFSALDFTTSSKNQYAYMLEGYDEDWIYCGKRRYVAYTNLSPGEYLFKVRASNNDGYWNNKGISIAIIIIPPFYLTAWFKILVIISLLVASLIFYKLRIQQLKKEAIIHQKFSKKLIDSQEAERFRIASELHDGLGQNLLVIINRAKISLNKPQNYPAETQLRAIYETALESIEEVRKIARNLHPYQLDSVGISKIIEEMIDRLNEVTEIKFNHDIDNIDNIFSREEAVNIFRIVQEATNNIIKHSKTKTAYIKIKLNENTVSLIIEDEGSGITRGKLDDILIHHKGFGLISLLHRVEILNGTFDINSVENKGTKICITIPRGNKNGK